MRRREEEEEEEEVFDQCWYRVWMVPKVRRKCPYVSHENFAFDSTESVR